MRCKRNRPIVSSIDENLNMSKCEFGCENFGCDAVSVVEHAPDLPRRRQIALAFDCRQSSITAQPSLWNILSPDASNAVCVCVAPIGCHFICNLHVRDAATCAVCTILPRYLDKLWQIELKSFLWNAKMRKKMQKVKKNSNHNICWMVWPLPPLPLLLTRHFVVVYSLHDDFFDAICTSLPVRPPAFMCSHWIEGTIYCLANWYIYLISIRFIFPLVYLFDMRRLFYIYIQICNV